VLHYGPGLTNIRLDCKCILKDNTLAYLSMFANYVQKSFITSFFREKKIKEKIEKMGTGKKKNSSTEMI
jgi:hypothetical protein